MLLAPPLQHFFIDHTAKTTTFIDPRLPLEWPLLLLPATAAAAAADAAQAQTPPIYAAYAADSVLLTPTSSQVGQFSALLVYIN